MIGCRGALGNDLGPKIAVTCPLKGCMRQILEARQNSRRSAITSALWEWDVILGAPALFPERLILVASRRSVDLE